MSEEIKYRWIYRRIVKYKNKCYVIYVVKIKDKYRYSSTCLQNSIDYVLNFAEKNSIDLKQIIKSEKHTRIYIRNN
jgi:hypothetical protein